MKVPELYPYPTEIVVIPESDTFPPIFSIIPVGPLEDPSLTLTPGTKIEFKTVELWIPTCNFLGIVLIALSISLLTLISLTPTSGLKKNTDPVLVVKLHL